MELVSSVASKHIFFLLDGILRKLAWFDKSTRSTFFCVSPTLKWTGLVVQHPISYSKLGSPSTLFTTSHCTFFSIYVVWCVWEDKVRHRNVPTVLPNHEVHSTAPSFCTRCFPAPGRLPGKLIGDAEVQDVGSAWSGGCAAFAIAGNLTCKSGREDCLGTMLGRWYRCSKWQIKFSINGMYYWS